MHLGRPGIIPLSQNEKTYICFHLIVLRNMNLKYIYEINQVKANFYVLSLYVVYRGGSRICGWGGMSRRGVWGPLKVPSGSNAEPW